MMYNNVLKEILTDYERRRDELVIRQRLRKEEIYRRIPEIRIIDQQIFEIGLTMSRAIIENPDHYERDIEDIKEQIEKLQMEKAYLLTENNIPADYMDIKYACKHCEDTGFLTNGERCNCLTQNLINKAYEMSNIRNVLEEENFDTFNINIFPDETYDGEDLSPRENMREISSICVDFVNNFDEDNGENLLFYGSTGLGKTFMSNCIAKALLDMNKIVIYQTAFKILEMIERRRFGRDAARFEDKEYDLLFDCDLLIIDDLGTELSNAFTNAEIFNIVNTRLLAGKKTIISTNLTPKEISDIYTDRVFSRVLEKFIPLKFYGPDLRYYQWAR